MTVGEWQLDGGGNSTRVLSYTISINNPLGPKTAPDYFYTIHRYCLTSLGKNKSRIRERESEVCKLETLLQSEVSVVTSGEAGSGDGVQGLSALRRRKRLGSRRATDTEREGASNGSPKRRERGLGDD
ncbi:hypothetical protein CRUP_037971, partial [Coryphaenoides rupestris]